MSEPGPGPEQELTEEQLRQLEAELERIHIDDVLLQTIVQLINLGARKGAVGAPPEAGLVPDNEQLAIAIDAAGRLVEVVAPRHADKIGPLRDAVSQLQLAYAQQAGAGGAVGGQPGPSGPAAQPGGAGGSAGAGPAQQQPGDAQRSGRLWIPGQ